MYHDISFVPNCKRFAILIGFGVLSLTYHCGGPGFDPRPIHVGFAADTVAVGEMLPRASLLSLILSIRIDTINVRNSSVLKQNTPVCVSEPVKFLSNQKRAQSKTICSNRNEFFFLFRSCTRLTPTLCGLHASKLVLRRRKVSINAPDSVSFLGMLTEIVGLDTWTKECQVQQLKMLGGAGLM